MYSASLRKEKSASVLARFRQLSGIKKGVIMVIVVGFLGFVGFTVFSQKNKASPYQTAQAQRGSIIATVSESGAISANSQVSVTSPSTGIIQDVYVKNGDTVTAGQNLFSVKATATPQEQASAYATYTNALSSVKSAEQSKQVTQAILEKDRQAVLDAQNTVNYKNNNSTNPSTKQGYTDLEKVSIDSALINARETFTADETKYNQAGFSIAAANAQLNSASLSYQATQNSVVTAPTAGTVANLSVRSGNSVTATSGNNNASSSNSSSGSSASTSNTSSSGSSTATGSTVLVIGNFSQLSVVAQVNEVDIPKIKVGQKATITLEAFSGKTFVGNIESVDSVGTTSSGVVTYNVHINLISPPSDIYAGMTTSVVIQTDRRDNVITVPTTAVQTANGSSYVRVLKNKKVMQVPVMTGIASDTETEIISGINEGEMVVTGTLSTGTSTGGGTASPFGRSIGGFGGGRVRVGGGG